MKPSSPDDTPVEAWLRSSASLPPLPDDGFSHRVLAALPPPARRRANRLRLVLCLAGALAGVALVLQHSPDFPDIFHRLEQLDPVLNQATSQLADPAFAIALGVTAASLLFVFWRDIRLLPRF